MPELAAVAGFELRHLTQRSIAKNNVGWHLARLGQLAAFGLEGVEQLEVGGRHAGELIGTLARLAPPLWIPRAGYPIPAGSNEAAEGGEGFMLPNLSSTLVREYLAAGRADGLEGLVPTPVLRLINERRLYSKP